MKDKGKSKGSTGQGKGKEDKGASSTKKGTRGK
jgi:hypothetical protein